MASLKKRKHKLDLTFGVTNYDRIITNDVSYQPFNLTSTTNTLDLDDYIFINGHEYHMFIVVPNGITLSNYNKDKAILALWIGADRWQTAPWQLRLRVNVDNGVTNNNQILIPFNWYAANLEDDKIMHFSVLDTDDVTRLTLASGQTLTFNIRGTVSSEI